MENALLAVSLLSCIALIVSVLLQRSEGGALGMGGGGGGGLVSGRGAADTLVRTTMVLAAIFFIASLALTRINNERTKDGSEVTRTLEETGDSLLNSVLGEEAVSVSEPEEPKDLISEALSDESVSDGSQTDENSTSSPDNQ